MEGLLVINVAMHCEKLHAFADGELPSAEVPEFQQHLVRCSSCRSELRDVMIIEALALGLAPPRPSGWTHAPVGVMPPTHPSGSIAVTRSTPLGRAHPWALKAGMAAAAAAMIVVVIGRRQASNPVSDLLSDGRPFPARVVYPPADRYRPLRVMRGEQDQAPPSMEALARLESSGDQQGLAVAYLLAGVFDRAEVALGRAPAGAGREINRAVLAMQRRQWHEARELLESLLTAVPRQPQARWNLALVYEELGDSEGAARAFEAVAALREPGWSSEASERARGLRAH
jgi:tetratricopeptide repeat protein/putative zinc finger protein